jgi:uncharacterized damage-inducible protein DinB
VPTPLIDALASHFESVFAGPNGDYPAILEVLAGIGASQALWKPTPSCNSIWQITDHVMASKTWALDMLEKGHANSPVWSEPPGGEAAWRASLARLNESHARLKAAIASVPEEELLTRPLQPDWHQTQLEFMMSWAAHEAYHAGQIDYLRGLQSAEAHE